MDLNISISFTRKRWRYHCLPEIFQHEAERGRRVGHRVRAM